MLHRIRRQLVGSRTLDGSTRWRTARLADAKNVPYMACPLLVVFTLVISACSSSTAPAEASTSAPASVSSSTAGPTCTDLANLARLTRAVASAEAKADRGSCRSLPLRWTPPCKQENEKNHSMVAVVPVQRQADVASVEVDHPCAPGRTYDSVPPRPRPGVVGE